MKPKAICNIALLVFCLLSNAFLYAQHDTTCKVTVQLLEGSYTGDCKHGLANGKGEANGFNRYVGSFKDGKPDGEGIYYFADSVFYTGSFQDGIKEGKGEMHYVRGGKADSVVKGFWSADEYRGKKYITYAFTTTEQFDVTDITPSNATGNTLTIEIGTTSGSPNGEPTGASGFILRLSNITSPTNSILKTVSKYESSFKSYATYQLISFPCKVFGTLSNGETFELEMYKAANWKVSLYKNK